jgi:hypothetical protein
LFRVSKIKKQKSFIGSQENHRIFTRKTIDIILPFRFFLIVRTIVPPSSIDSDQVIDRNIHKTKKKKLILSQMEKEKTTSGLRFPTLQTTFSFSACGRVVWSLRQTGKNDVEYCITFMLFFESATSE